MAWTAPVTRATGYLVLASDWNNEHVNNLLYLHGDAGNIDISVGGATLLPFGVQAAPATTKQTEVGIDRIGGGQAAVGFSNANAGAPDVTLFRWAAGILAVGSTATSGMGGLITGSKTLSSAIPATWTPDIKFGFFQQYITTSGGAATLTIASPTNSLTGGTSTFLCLRIWNGSGATATLSWNAIYVSNGITALPANCANGAKSTSLFGYDENQNKWALLAVN